MIEKIFIPTIRRADKQTTYENLPEKLQSRVTMVIDPSERHLYSYPCHYLELPKDIIGQWTQLAKTRKFIHEYAGKIKYAMIDDDLIVMKRNSKYWTGVSDMETSKRLATKDEIIRMFDTASTWLDEEDIGIVGLSDNMLPPLNTEYADTKGVFGFLFLDGRMLSEIASDLDTSVRISEDVLFLFECLSKGINTRIMNEFLFSNKSLTAEFRNKRPAWEDLFENEMPKDYFQTKEHYDALRYIQKKFPEGITIFEEDGRMKNVKHWKKLYKQKNTNTIESFLHD